MEHNGRERARPYVEAAGASFPTLADEHGLTSCQLGFKAVPNGILVDADGIVRYAKLGGFSIDNPEDVAVVERFVAGLDPGPSPTPKVPYRLGPVETELIETKLRLGHLLNSLGRYGEAVTEWRAALRVDPENLVIRKQIWAAVYPERFFPTIDWAWQKEQLASERADEIADGVCGPDGCPLPATRGR